MARIFLSHSSKDDFAAVAVRDWLNENGWEDVFLDLDPAEGIRPGERWERALYEHAARCEAVVFLVSHHWLASDWCRREFELAHKLNKRIFVVLIDAIPIHDLPSYLTETHQAVSLAAGADHRVLRVTRPGTHEERHVSFSAEGLARLRAGLTQAGLDPRFFAWPPAAEPSRAPYRGLEPLEAVDAGIFFGREAPVIEALDALRGLREAACPRLFVILGASGAGKSSFLRAGLLPRLVRDDRGFLPLSPIRPERSAVTGTNGLVSVLAAACVEKGMTATRAQLREAASQGAEALRPYLKELASRAGSIHSAPRLPTLIIAVDQAEELFRAEGAQEGERLLALLREFALVDDPAVIALFAIRSDSYDALEHAKPLEGLSQKVFPLLPMPRSAYQTVIEAPARRLERAGRQFDIDPSLTQALLADLEKGGGSDALPLLAFTLEQLFCDHQAAGRLTRADYDTFGGLKGAIDAAIARVFVEADKDARIPRDPDARLALMRRALIPWLAGIDPETKTPRRRRAPAAQMPTEARPLVDLLVEQRLLTRAVDDVSHEITLEPAHEALLRQWGSLKGWLDEDFSRLVTLEGVKRATRDWDANARDPAWAAHGGARLAEAARLDSRPDLAALLDPTDRAYLAACGERETETLAKERALVAATRRAAHRTRIGLAVSSALAVIAMVAAAYGFRQAQIAGEQEALARQRGEIAEQRKQDAERQTLKAEQETVKAEQERSKAEQERSKAEQRSAVLATGAAKSLTAEGALDQALLLMLDAARVFDDASVPDEIRIAITKILQKQERTETKTLFPNMRVFTADNALLLFDPSTNDIWTLTDSINPKRLVAGAPNDSAILELRQSTDRKDYVVLRENLMVERITAADGARRKIGLITEPKTPPGLTYKLDETTVTDDGLVVRKFLSSAESDTKYYFQAFDSESGQVIEGELPDGASVLQKRAQGGVYAYDNIKEEVIEIMLTGDRLLTRPAQLSQQQRATIRFGDCVAKMVTLARQSAVSELQESLNPGGTFNCKTIGRHYLIETTNHISSGMDRSDTFIQFDGKKTNVRQTLESLVPGRLPRNNIAWVGGFPTTRSLAASLKTSWLSVLLNRNAYVLSKEDGSEKWTLLLDVRHPTPVAHAQFIGSDRLVVVNAESGRLVLHDFGAQERKKLLAGSLKGIIGTESPVQTLHQGTCVGYAMPREKKALMPDGREIVFDTPDVTHSNQKHELRVSGPSDMVIELGESANCIQFSADWKRLLIVRETTVDIYDFQNVLEHGILAGNEVATLPASTNAAFFSGALGRRIITADRNRVLLWSLNAEGKDWESREIYSGDSPIISAEPDASGNRLIILESLGEGDVHGLFYSIGAREIWYDLGNDYKWLGAAFTTQSEIVVSEHGEWKRVYPVLSLSRLVEIADQQLSPECRPPALKDYRKSPCWPTSLQ